MTCTGNASHPARCAAGAPLPVIMACPLYLQVLSIPADVEGNLGASFGGPHESPSPCPPPRSAPPMASQCPDESVTLAGPAGLIITAVDEDFNGVDDGHAVCAPRPRRTVPALRRSGSRELAARPIARARMQEDPCAHKVVTWVTEYSIADKLGFKRVPVALGRTMRAWHCPDTCTSSCCLCPWARGAQAAHRDSKTTTDAGAWLQNHGREWRGPQRSA